MASVLPRRTCVCEGQTSPDRGCWRGRGRPGPAHSPPAPGWCRGRWGSEYCGWLAAAGLEQQGVFVGEHSMEAQAWAIDCRLLDDSQDEVRGLKLT